MGKGIRSELEQLGLTGTMESNTITELFTDNNALGSLAYLKLCPLPNGKFSIDGDTIYREVHTVNPASIATIATSREMLQSFHKQLFLLELLDTPIGDYLFADVDSLDVRTGQYFFQGHLPADDLAVAAKRLSLDPDVLYEQGKRYVERQLELNKGLHARLINNSPIARERL